MAELITTERRAVTIEARLADECRRLQTERDAALRLAHAQPVAPPPGRSNAAWIVGGSLAALAILVSFAWSVFTAWMASMENAAVRHHELALAAVERAKPPVSGSPDNDMLVVGTAIGLAFVMILIGLMRR